VSRRRTKAEVYEDLIRAWLERVRTVNDPNALRQMAEQFIAMLIAGTAMDHGMVVGGANPHLTLVANTSRELEILKNAFGIMWPELRLEIVGDQGDVAKPICRYCGARVRVPCNESRSNACANRSRGNR